MPGWPPRQVTLEQRREPQACVQKSVQQREQPKQGLEEGRAEGMSSRGEGGEARMALRPLEGL